MGSEAAGHRAPRAISRIGWKNSQPAAPHPGAQERDRADGERPRQRDSVRLRCANVKVTLVDEMSPASAGEGIPWS
jgi:hypothetical protein